MVNKISLVVLFLLIHLTYSFSQESKVYIPRGMLIDGSPMLYDDYKDIEIQLYIDSFRLTKVIINMSGPNSLDTLDGLWRVGRINPICDNYYCTWGGKLKLISFINIPECKSLKIGENESLREGIVFWDLKQIENEGQERNQYEEDKNK